MAAAALVTNTSSPEPQNSALLNFMKGLVVQFMSLPAEDMSVQRQRKHCSTTSDEITQNKKFYPWQYFFSRFILKSKHKTLCYIVFLHDVKESDQLTN